MNDRTDEFAQADEFAQCAREAVAVEAVLSGDDSLVIAMQAWDRKLPCESYYYSFNKRWTAFKPKHERCSHRSTWVLGVGGSGFRAYCCEHGRMRASTVHTLIMFLPTGERLETGHIKSIASRRRAMRKITDKYHTTGDQ